MPSIAAAAVTSAAKAYWIAGAMIATIVTARYLGAEGRGIIAAATSWVSLFVTVGHLSLASMVVFLVGREGGAEGRARLPAIAGSVIALNLATTLLGWIVVAGVAFWTDGRAFAHIPAALLIVAFAGLPFLLFQETGNALLTAMGDIRRLNVAQVAGTTCGIVLVVVTVALMHGGVIAALSSTLGSYVVVCAIAIVRVYAECRSLTISRPLIGELLRGGARLHLGAVSTFFFTHASIILLNQFRPVPEVGYFQLAMQLTVAVQIVPMAVATVALSLVARDGAEGAWPEHRRLVRHTMIYAAVAAVLLFVAAPWIVVLLAGAPFASAVPMVRILTLSIFGSGLSTVMGPQWIARGYFMPPSALSVAACVLGLAANWLLIPTYGMYACAWVMVASYGIHLVGNGAFAWWIESR